MVAAFGMNDLLAIFFVGVMVGMMLAAYATYKVKKFFKRKL